MVIVLALVATVLLPTVGAANILRVGASSQLPVASVSSQSVPVNTPVTATVRFSQSSFPLWDVEWHWGNDPITGAPIVEKQHFGGTPSGPDFVLQAQHTYAATGSYEVQVWVFMGDPSGPGAVRVDLSNTIPIDVYLPNPEVLVRQVQEVQVLVRQMPDDAFVQPSTSTTYVRQLETVQTLITRTNYIPARNVVENVLMSRVSASSSPVPADAQVVGSATNAKNTKEWIKPEYSGQIYAVLKQTDVELQSLIATAKQPK